MTDDKHPLIFCTCESGQGCDVVGHLGPYRGDKRPPIPTTAQLIREWNTKELSRLRARVLELTAILETILELAERSDAHPELPIADIAREALGK